MAELVTFGETMALFIGTEPGPLRRADTLHVTVGGSESNVAIGVQRLGHATAWMGRVGDDEFGLKVLGVLRSEGVAVDAVTFDDEAPTGLMFKTRRTGQKLQVQYYRKGSAASRFEPRHLDEAGISHARILHVSGITPALSPSARETVFCAVEVARSSDTLVSFDPNYRAALWPIDEAGRCFRDLIKRADVVLTGEEEAACVVGGGSDTELAARLGELGPPQVVVKQGGRGAVAHIEGRALSVDAVPVEVVDPVGAGDAFAAGYLAGILEDRPPEDRLSQAAVLGAFAVTVRGDWEGLPTRDELGLLGDTGSDVQR